MKVKFFKIFLIQMFLILFVFCGEKESSKLEEGKSENSQEDVSSETIEIIIKPVGDQQKYDTTEFTVPTGSKVKLVLQNIATMKEMIHNVVITKPGTDTNKIGQAAIAAKDKDFIPESDEILFYTPLANPGETVEIEFIAPEPGDYPYVCTYTGHFIFMKGVMKVIE